MSDDCRVDPCGLCQKREDLLLFIERCCSSLALDDAEDRHVLVDLLLAHFDIHRNAVQY